MTSSVLIRELFFRNMYHTMDTTDVDRGPIRDNAIQMSLFYVCFVVLFSFFFLNIFVALIIVTFQERGEKYIPDCDLDRNQVCAATLPSRLQTIKQSKYLT